jgi:hypothetical protein
MTRSTIVRYREAEVKCLHCGCIAGLLRQLHDQPSTRAAFHNAGGGTPRIIKSLTELRCARCGGSVYSDEYELRYVHPKLDDVDRPRRGRPPKWLVEERRAREAALESA